MQERARMTPMVDIIEKVKKEGYAEDFMVMEEGVLCTLDRTASFSPDQIRIVDFYRFEHDTHPDDMAILYVIETVTGLKGTLSDAYGTYHDSRTENFMRQVEDLGKNVDKHT